MGQEGGLSGSEQFRVADQSFIITAVVRGGDYDDLERHVRRLLAAQQGNSAWVSNRSIDLFLFEHPTFVGWKGV
jgi:hypothetical protein